MVHLFIFWWYTADVTAIAGRHNVSVHSYADDTQLYTSCFAVDGPASAVQLLRCVDDISQWMASNRLKLNVDKTQFMWLGSPRQLVVSQVQLIVGGEVVTASDTVRDLGVTLDAQLTMKNHVDGVARSCFYQLRQLRSVHRSVPTYALHTLVHAFISSHIDYCNTVLYGATDAVIRRLQAVLHAAARLITGVRRNNHVMPTLRDTLHWLPVSQRITFKIAQMTYDCIHGRSPVYFRDICSPIVSVPFRSWLRSADNDDMIVPRTRTACYGPRSFRIAAPQFSNMLPPHLKNSNVSREQLKSSLKTWLFVQAYS